MMDASQLLFNRWVQPPVPSVDAFTKTLSNYRREAKRPRPDDDGDDVVDADHVVDATI